MNLGEVIFMVWVKGYYWYDDEFLTEFLTDDEYAWRRKQ